MKFSDFNLDKTGDGLLPVIIQDATTLKVLMLGYMNEEAFGKSVETGLVTFWSRTRQALWTKGETSGNYLHVVDMWADCDGDTLLIKARPDGPTCHRGTTACFDTPEDEGFIRKGPKAIGKKVIEEAGEAVIEAVDGKRDRFVYEASDLIYHLLVLLESQGVSPAELEHELALRHR